MPDSNPHRSLPPLNADPVREDQGLDLYMDASGCDNWSNSERFYLSGVIATTPRPQWVEWMHQHQFDLGGRIHFSERIIGDGTPLYNTADVCRQILTNLPWSFSFVVIQDKQSIIDMMTRVAGSGAGPQDYSAAAWKMLPGTLGLGVMDLINRAFQRPAGTNGIRKVVINNPSSGDLNEIRLECQRVLHREPEFVPNGHPGIDAVDGLLWAFRRFVELGRSDAVPWSATEPIPTQIIVGGVRGRAVTRLASLAEVQRWKSEA